MEFKDYYATLGVSKGSESDQIKRAFRRLAKKHHPDLRPGDKDAEKRFKDINEAYEVVGDPENRRKYDELGMDWKHYEQAQQARQSPFGQGHPFSTSRGFRNPAGRQHRSPFTAEPFSDFFTSFFQSGAEDPQQTAQRKQRTDHPLVMTLEEAFSGVSRRVSLATGADSKSLEVRVPAGVDNGSRIRVTGLRKTNPSTAELFFLVQLKKHPVFDRKGKDLFARVNVSLVTAILGGEVGVPSIEGKSLRLRVPPTTQQGQRFRFKGYGMPTVNVAGRGSLYVTVQVQLPTAITPNERDHYEALAKLSARDHSDPAQES